MKAVIFDLDDTLYRIQDYFDYAVMEVIKDFEPNNLPVLYREFRNASNRYFTASQNGLMEMNHMRNMRLIDACSHFNYSVCEDTASIFQKEYAKRVYQAKLSNSVREILEELNSLGVEIGIITNGESKHQWTKINNMGILNYVNRSNIIVSGDIGIDKPNVKIFRKMESKMSHISEFIYVGDSYENDVLGSIKAGWRNIWFNMDCSNKTSIDLVANNYLELRKLLVDFVIKND